MCLYQIKFWSRSLIYIKETKIKKVETKKEMMVSEREWETERKKSKNLVIYLLCLYQRKFWSRSLIYKKGTKIKKVEMRWERDDDEWKRERETERKKSKNLVIYLLCLCQRKYWSRSLIYKREKKENGDKDYKSRDKEWKGEKERERETERKKNKNLVIYLLCLYQRKYRTRSLIYYSQTLWCTNICIQCGGQRK